MHLLLILSTDILWNSVMFCWEVFSPRKPQREQVLHLTHVYLWSLKRTAAAWRESWGTPAGSTWYSSNIEKPLSIHTILTFGKLHVVLGFPCCRGVALPRSLGWAPLLPFRQVESGQQSRTAESRKQVASVRCEPLQRPSWVWGDLKGIWKLVFYFFCHKCSQLGDISGIALWCITDWMLKEASSKQVGFVWGRRSVSRSRSLCVLYAVPHLLMQFPVKSYHAPVFWWPILTEIVTNS